MLCHKCHMRMASHRYEFVHVSAGCMIWWTGVDRNDRWTFSSFVWCNTFSPHSLLFAVWTGDYYTVAVSHHTRAIFSARWSIDNTRPHRAQWLIWPNWQSRSASFLVSNFDRPLSKISEQKTIDSVSMVVVDLRHYPPSSPQACVVVWEVGLDLAVIHLLSLIGCIVSSEYNLHKQKNKIKLDYDLTSIEQQDCVKCGTRMFSGNQGTCPITPLDDGWCRTRFTRVMWISIVSYARNEALTKANAFCYRTFIWHLGGVPVRWWWWH